MFRVEVYEDDAPRPMCLFCSSSAVATIRDGALLPELPLCKTHLGELRAATGDAIVATLRPGAPG